MCLILGFSIIVLLSYFAEIFFLKSLAEITLVHSRHSRAGGKPGLPCIPAWIPGRASYRQLAWNDAENCRCFSNTRLPQFSGILSIAMAKPSRYEPKSSNDPFTASRANR